MIFSVFRRKNGTESLLHRDALGQIPGLVDVAATLQRNVVAQQLSLIHICRRERKGRSDMTAWQSYASPVGELLLAADEEGLTGL